MNRDYIHSDWRLMMELESLPRFNNTRPKHVQICHFCYQLTWKFQTSQISQFSENNTYICVCLLSYKCIFEVIMWIWRRHNKFETNTCCDSATSKTIVPPAGGNSRISCTYVQNGVCSNWIANIGWQSFFTTMPLNGHHQAFN